MPEVEITVITRYGHGSKKLSYIEDKINGKETFEGLRDLNFEGNHSYDYGNSQELKT